MGFFLVGAFRLPPQEHSVVVSVPVKVCHLTDVLRFQSLVGGFLGRRGNVFIGAALDVAAVVFRYLQNTGHRDSMLTFLAYLCKACVYILYISMYVWIFRPR